MALDWRDTLRTLRTQFEAKATWSSGLHHLFTEAADNERDKCWGPPWFKAFDGTPRVVDGKIIYDKWDWSSAGGLPGVEPGFREIEQGEDVSSINEQNLIRDKSGVARTVLVPMKVRTGFYCGPAADLVPQFESLASAAATALAAATDLTEHPLATELTDLFRPPRGGVRYVFGEVTDQPRHFVARGWNAGVLQYGNGVLIDMPISESSTGEGHWLLLLHRLGWRSIRGGMLRAMRSSWDGQSEVEYSMLHRDLSSMGSQFAERFAKFSKESFYSVIGSKETPDDIFLTSAFAINLLLASLTDEGEAQVDALAVDYSQQTWHIKAVPTVKSVSKGDVSADRNPKIGIVVATEIERIAVLKRMTPQKGGRSIKQVFDVIIPISWAVSD